MLGRRPKRRLLRAGWVLVFSWCISGVAVELAHSVPREGVAAVRRLEPGTRANPADLKVSRAQPP
ncbi:hypothetical protein D3C71_1911640 [compost metagenome]